MADNTGLTAMSGGDVIATDDIASGVASGAKVQRVKVGWGTDGTYVDAEASAGLPTQSAWREVSGSASANNTDLISTDAAGYRWVSVHLTGTFNATVAFQGSNDNTNWVSVYLVDATNVNVTPAASGNATGRIHTGPLPTRYFRARTTSYSSGTPTATCEFAAGATAVNPYAQVPITGTVGVSPGSTAADATTNPSSSALQVLGFVSGFNGASWDRLRVPAVVKTATATASGNTALWTPTSGKKFRLMRFKMDLTQDVAQSSGGALAVGLQDSSTVINVTQSAFVPGTAATTMGSGWTSGWIDLGNGVLSAAANNVLNISLGAALTSGTARVIACGTEE